MTTTVPTAMGKSMNLKNLTAEEAEQILQVIQKDFELRQRERERLSKIEEDISEEDNKTTVLTKQEKFNENCCIRCCQTFGVIFNRKQMCQACKLFVCKSCADYDDSIKGYVCKACSKEVELKQKSFNWFYENVGRRFKRFGSAKVVRTLYKHSDSSRSKFHSDNESDSGYDPSLYSSFGQSGSVRGVKNRPSLKAVFPEIAIKDDDQAQPKVVLHSSGFQTSPDVAVINNQLKAKSELDNGLFPPPPLTLSPNGNSFQESPNTSLEELSTSPGRGPPTPAPRTSVTTPTQTNLDYEEENDKNDIYQEAFENTKRTEEAKFKVRFDNLLTEMQTSFEKISPRDGSVPENFGDHSYGEQMTKYRARVKDMLVILSQRLELAVESFDKSCANSPTLTSQKVRQIISKLVEDRLGESLDLTSDEAVSDLSSLSDDSTDQKSFEEQIAQAVIARVLEQHRNVSGVHLSLDDPKDHRQSDSSMSEEKMTSRSRNSSVSEEKVVIHRNSVHSEDKTTNRSRNSSLSDDKGRKRRKSEEVNAENNNNISDESDKNAYTAEEDGDEEEVVDDIDGEIVVESPNKSGSQLHSVKEKARSKSESDSASTNSKDDNNSSVRTPKEVIAVDEKKLLQEEFNKLRNFAQEVVPKPLYEEVNFVEDIEEEPIVENMERVEVDHEESQAEFQSRFFTYDKVHESENSYHLPDFSDLDYEYHDFGVNEIDPDLLSMNLAPILEETEEELEEEEGEGGDEESEQDWRGNWMFKGASGVNPYSNLSKTKVLGDFSDINIMVPTPAGDITPHIGNQGVDDIMSDLSENEDEDSLDGLSDEENSFYAKTSEEIARITRKTSSSTQNYPVANSAPHTEGETDTESVLSRQHSSSFSDSGIRGSRGGLDQNSFDSRVSEKSHVKLSEDLIPAEGDDPKFEIPPDTVTVPEGEPAKLTCRIAGTQPLDLFWYRVRGEVEELENSENYEVTKEGCRHHLTMYNMTKEDAGQYMCMAINEKGRCCQYFILHIKKNTQELKKPEFLKTPTDLEVTEGQSVKFRCKVKGYPQPRVIWYKDGQILLNKLNYRLERFGNRDYLLSIDSASMDEDAEYSVLAKNIAGETRASAQLIVEPKNKPESVPKVAKTKETMKPAETPKGDNKEAISEEPLYDISYLPWIKKSKKPTSPEIQKDNNNLSNIGQKLSMTKDSVTNVAEDMLSSTKEQEAAENVRKVTSSALDYINTADSFVMREKNMGAIATSTPRNSDTERIFNPYGDNSHFAAGESDIGGDNTQDTSEDSHKSEVSFSLTPMTMNTSSSKDDTIRKDSSSSVSSKKPENKPETIVGKTRESPSKSMFIDLKELKDLEAPPTTVTPKTPDESLSPRSDTDGPIRVNLGPKRENKEWHQKDFYITNTPMMQRKNTPEQSPREEKQRALSPREEKQRVQSPREEKQRAHTEEKIYLAANNVYNLENKVQSLQDKMRAVNALSDQDKMTRLENQVAKTVAQVASTEKQVKEVEKSVSKMADPHTEGVKKPSSVKSKHAPSAPVKQQAPPPPKPEPTFLKGDTKEQDLPESRTEFNEEYGSGFELPSVSRLKAMFGGTRTSGHDGSFKRVHSITARSVPKGQLEKLKEAAADDPKSRVQVVSASQPPKPGRATALTTGQQIKSTPATAKQVFQSSSLSSSFDNTSFNSVNIPKQSIQVSTSTKTGDSGPRAAKSMKLTLSTCATNRPVSPDQSDHVSPRSPRPITTPVTKPASVPSNSQSEASTDNVVISGADIDTPEHRKSPKIKSGAINAMSKFWERLNDGKQDQAPDILEYD